jgi:Transposase DDE domain
MSGLGAEHQRNALAFTAAWALGYRAYTIPTLNLPMASILAGPPSTTAATAVSSPSSIYSTLREIGGHSDEILSKMPEVNVEKAAADIHAVPKFCEGLDVRYTPHKSSPCACRAVEVIAEISKKGTARPLSIEPVRGKAVKDGKEERRKKTTVVVVDELRRIASFLEEKCGRKVPLEVDAEYTKSREALKLLVSSGWKFTTRIRSDSLLGREVKAKILSEGLDVSGRWYRNEEYGGRFQIVGRKIQRKGEPEPTVILHLSTRKLSPERVIEERRDRWRIENFFKNVDIDSTPGNDDDELRGYYTLAFFMAEMGRAFGASTRTIGLIMDREGRITVKGGTMKVHLEGLDRRLLRKIASYVNYINHRSRGRRAKLHYKLMRG